MNVTHAAQLHKAKPLHRKAVPVAEEEPLTRTDYADGGVVDLQRLIGNRGVQRLIAQGQITSRRVGLPPLGGVVRRKCSCGCCNGTHEEEEASSGTAVKGEQVQRWWDDEEESSDDGDGWTDWVSDTADEAVNTVESWFGDDEAESEESSWGTDEESEGGDWYSEDESESDGGSWWETDEESETEAEDDSDSWTDWFNWSDDSDEEVHEIPEVNVGCVTDEGIGFGGGSGGSISLHGKTVANYDHAQPIPAPFPSSVTVTTSKVGSVDVFSASGTFDVTFKASPSITLPNVPSGLTECQEKAVRAFIDGPLTAHENDHANAFTSNYDGTFTASINVKNIKDTPDQRQAAMEAPVQKEDVARVTKANAASKKLDPWNQTIPGLDCED